MRSPGAAAADWDRLRLAGLRPASWLRSPGPARPGCCAVCRGPAAPGYLRCYQCAAHRALAPGLLADAVVPVSYAVAGTAYAHALWAYKSDAADRDAARAALRLVLVTFLRDHGPCVWASAGMARPSLAAVVPSGCGRPGTHPLRTLVDPYLALPWAVLVPRAAEPVHQRDLLAGRFAAAGPVEGAAVMLIDDTWTSGSSAQSAVLALRLAGAARVAVVVLGRHLNPREPAAAALAASPYRPRSCAAHAVAPG